MKDVQYIVNIGKHQLDSLWIEKISCILKKSLKNIVRIYMYFWSDRKGLMCQMYTSRYNKYTYYNPLLTEKQEPPAFLSSRPYCRGVKTLSDTAPRRNSG